MSRGPRTPLTAAAVLVAAVSVLVLAGSASAAQDLPTPAPVPGEAPTPPAPSDAPSPSPSPSLRVPDPQPAEPPTPPPATPGIGVGWLDPVGVVTEAVSRWVGELVDSALAQVWALLSTGLLVNPDVTAVPRVVELWQLSLRIANATYALAVLVGGIYVMAHQTVQTRYGLGDILPRLVVAGLAANLNLLLIRPLIELGNAVSVALTGETQRAGVDALRDVLVSAMGGLSNDLFAQLAAGLVALVGLAVAFTYVVRVAVLVLVVVGAPVALACHAVPALDGAAKVWWRALGACVAIPVVQALVVSTAVQVWAGEDGRGLLGLTGTTSGLVTLLVVGCLLWVLAKVPVWAARQVATPRGGIVVSTLKYYLVSRAIRGALGAGHPRPATTPAAAATPAAPPAAATTAAGAAASGAASRAARAHTLTVAAYDPDAAARRRPRRPPPHPRAAGGRPGRTGPGGGSKPGDGEHGGDSGAGGGER